MQAIADFNVRPSEEEIVEMLEYDNKYCHDPATREDVEKAIQKAKEWLDWATKEVNREFSFRAAEEGVSIKVQYREGEDLGWTCKLPGSLPFNDVYPEGPTVHVEISGRVSIRPKTNGYQNGLDSFVMTETDKGFLLIIRMPKQKMFVAFRNV